MRRDVILCTVLQAIIGEALESFACYDSRAFAVKTKKTAIFKLLFTFSLLID